MRDYFYEFHPLVTFVYFSMMLAFSMLLMHPICLILSFIGGCSYIFWIKGKKSILKHLLMLLFISFFGALINAAFNHEGMTILLYFSNGNPLTLEAIIYGCFAGMMLLVVLIWFEGVTANLTSDKLIYLFGKVMPVLGLILSMILRFVPYFKRQLMKIEEAQRGLKQEEGSSLLEKIKQALHRYSILITWALENTIDTADAMKSRGYGLKGRSCFSIFKITKRDQYLLGGILLVAGIISYGVLKGVYAFQFYPYIKRCYLTKSSFGHYMLYGLFCILPCGVNIWEDYKWNCLE